MNKQINASDVLFIGAKASKALGKIVGVDIDITKFYSNDKAIKAIALASAFLRQAVEEVSGNKIEVLEK